MSVHDEINIRLAEFSPVYDEIGSLRKALDNLEQAELAQSEYTQQTSDLNDELDALTKKHRELESPSKQTQVKDVGLELFRPTSKTSVPTSTHRFEPKATPSSTAHQPIQRTRTELQKIIMRWGYVLKLSGETRGRINRIASDPLRPLGEALALLEWSVFQNRIGSEKDEEHLARLISWGDALAEYRERLVGEIDMLKIKYRLLMPILEAWSQRDTESGRENWDKQIAETNAAKKTEVERLRNEIARLIARG
jgi:hypothetical protein